jgi:hypothetical protein
MEGVSLEGARNARNAKRLCATMQNVMQLCHNRSPAEIFGAGLLVSGPRSQHGNLPCDRILRYIDKY